MVTKEGIYEYIIDAYLTDFRGKATLPMLGGFMLQAATRHAEERSFGYSAMTRMQKAWVLMRMNIELYSYPDNDRVLRVHTWISEVNRFTTERCFAFEDHRGNYLGYARSTWALIDMETRRPTQIIELEGLPQIQHQRECPLGSPSKIPPMQDATLVSNFEVKYSDIDINKHLNSLKYIEHIVDVFPMEAFECKEIRTFDINYMAEGQYGDQIDIWQKETDLNRFVVEMKNNDKVICSAKIGWE